jgi:Kef-type K+ transport system membrane component KefB
VLFVQLTVLVLAGLAGPLLAIGRRSLVPVVVGELIAGVVLGQTGFGVIDAGAQPLTSFKAIGFAMLMLSAGTRVDIGSPAIREGFLRGLTALAVVAALAVPLGVLLAHTLGIGNPALVAVLIAGSSAAVAFPILEENNLKGRNITFLIAWVAIADTVTVVLMPLTLAGSGNVLAAIGGDAAIVAAGALVLVVMSRVRKTQLAKTLRDQSLQRGWALQVRVSLLLLVGLSAIAERTGASPLVAGFLAGMVIVRLREPGRLVLQLTGLANGFFVPLFFVLLGAQINLRALVTEPSAMALAFALAAAAVVTHVVAARVRGSDRALATGLATSAQLGLPAAAASLGLSMKLLSAANAAALLAGGVLTLVPATIGSLMLANGSSRERADAASG